MTANYKDLSDILAGIGIDKEAQESVVEFGDWIDSDADIVLVKAIKVKSVLIDYVTSGMIEEFCDENELFLSEEELEYNVKDTFTTVPQDYYINIKG
jgi:hypothetical protein